MTAATQRGRRAQSSSASSSSLIPQLRIHVANRCEIRGPWPRVQFTKERVIARFRLQLRHAAAPIVEIAKHDRVRRTRLLARRLNLAVADPPIVLFRLDSRAVDPLHAV